MLGWHSVNNKTQQITTTSHSNQQQQPKFRAYLSVEKYRSSERSLKMAEKPGIPYKCKFANQGKKLPPPPVQLQWVIVGVCCCFFAQAYLKPLLAKLIG